MKELLHDTAARAVRYLDTINDRAIPPTADAIAALEKLAEPFPAAACDARDTMRFLDEIGSPATCATTGGRFFGFVIGGALPVTVASAWMAAAWDQPTGMYNFTPATARIEEVTLGWLRELLGLPAEFGGAFVTGATMANLSGLAAARHVVLREAGWNVEADGLVGAPPIHVVIGEEAHPTVFKSLGILGLGRSRVIKVPVDEQGRMRANRLPRISGPTIVIAQAGNVNTGAFDPIDAIVTHAHDAGAWVHVDGAFGLWAATSPRHASLVRGIEKADSMATDAHKWLNVPYDSGIAFVRDADALRAAMSVTAEYLPTETPHRNPSDYTPELSRRARGIEVWAALRTLGREGLAELIDRCCRQATRFADALRDEGCGILNDVVLNQVLVSFGSAERTRRIIDAIQKDGTCWCGGTVWQGKTAMRISVSSWATTDDDVNASLAAMRRAMKGAA